MNHQLAKMTFGPMLHKSRSGGQMLQRRRVRRFKESVELPGAWTAHVRIPCASTHNSDALLSKTQVKKTLSPWYAEPQIRSHICSSSYCRQRLSQLKCQTKACMNANRTCDINSIGGMHTCMHTYVHTYIHIHVYIHVYAHAYACIYVYSQKPVQSMWALTPPSSAFAMAGPRLARPAEARRSRRRRGWPKAISI